MTVTPGPRRVLIVSTVVPYPPAHGNQLHIFRLLRWLKEEGYEVILVLHPFEPVDEATLEEVRRLVFRVHLLLREDAPASNRLQFLRQRWLQRSDQAVRKLEDLHVEAPRFLRRWRLRHWEELHCPPALVAEVALRCRQYRPFAIIAQYIWTTRCFAAADPGTLRIVDTHDMFSTRKEKVVSFGIEDPLTIEPDEEAMLLSRADVIMTSQIDETRGMRNLGVDRRIFTIAIDMDVAEPPRKGDEVPGRVVIVASDNQANILGVRHFIERTWPHVVARHPEATLHVVGRVGNHIHHVGPGVTLMGFVPSVAEEYRRAQVVVNPVYCGSGLKIKSVEAMAHGKPLVAWPPGVEGLELEGEKPWLVGRHWQQLALRICQLLDDPQLRHTMSVRGREHVRARYARDVIYAALKEILERRSPE